MPPLRDTANKSGGPPNLDRLDGNVARSFGRAAGK